MSFGARLRAERQKRQISIATIAEATKILGALLEGLENDDVSRWPTGLYRRSFMREYARAIGLDPESTVKEFLERFPDPESPAPAPVPVPEPSPAVVVEDAGIGSLGPPVFRRGLRVGAPRSGLWFLPGTLVEGFGPRCLAVGVDWFVLCVTGLALFAALGMFWAPLSVAAAAYYSASILFLGNTPGVSLFARHLSSAEPNPSPMHHYERA